MSGCDPLRLALVGLGKIARDQHLPAIAANARTVLAATASPGEGLDGVPAFDSLETLLSNGPAFDAAVICTPPRVRHVLARQALGAGKHVMLEKPPAATLGELSDLVGLARVSGVCLMTAWHSRHAPAVEVFGRRLAERSIQAVRIAWKEDIRVWHPGQDWILGQAGLGVFDPGINALSIATAVLPRPFFLTDAELKTPANRQAPIAAELHFIDAAGVPILASFDFLQAGPQSWDIEADTDAGLLRLSHGGAKLWRDEVLILDTPEHEYRGVYERFADMVTHNQIDVDERPLRHVADAYLVGRRTTVEAFEF